MLRFAAANWFHFHLPAPILHSPSRISFPPLPPSLPPTEGARVCSGLFSTTSKIVSSITRLRDENGDARARGTSPPIDERAREQIIVLPQSRGESLVQRQ